MKNASLRVALAVVTIVAFVVCSFGVAYSQQKKKGVALQQLEQAAGKRIEDVKVPEAPKPTPVNTYGVDKSTSSTTSSFDVNTSTSTKKK